MSLRGRMQARAQARYDAATRGLQPGPDGSFDMDVVAERIADRIVVDVRAMQMRQATTDLELLRREDADDPGELQLNLFGEGSLVDYDPRRLVLGPNNRIVEHCLAPLDYKRAERDRAKANLDRAEAKHAIKHREVELFAKWSLEQRAAGRPTLDLTWGRCVNELGILRQRPDAA